MIVNIQSIDFNADKKLLALIQEKFDKLTHYYDGIVGGEVYLKLDKSSNLENKIVEFKVLIPGNDLFVKKNAKTFEEATDLALDAVTKQVKKYKEKVKGL